MKNGECKVVGDKSTNQEELIPRSWFESPLTSGLSIGSYSYLRDNRFSIVNLPYGYGKTLIAILTAVRLAKELDRDIQLGVLAPVSKRIDKSFERAKESAEKLFDVKLHSLYINGETIATFQGFTRMASDKAGFSVLDRSVKKRPTIFILDETHMNLRNPTTKTSKLFLKLLKSVEKAGKFVKVLGLTATPFDSSILDTIGYLVMNGDYTSRTDFYKKEVAGYENGLKRGMTIKNFEDMIIGKDFAINKRMFINIRELVGKINRIIYSPIVPIDFHIPENKFVEEIVELSPQGKEEIDWLKKLSKQKAFSSTAQERSAYLKVINSDLNILKRMAEITKKNDVVQPLIFYQNNDQRELLRDVLNKEWGRFSEINGEKHTFFEIEKINDDSPVMVQYRSGATAFEARLSNTSIYVGMPESSIEFDQSLGRNTRRDQEYDEVLNYILIPTDEKGKAIRQFEKQYNMIKNKRKRNEMFLKAFRSEWGEFGELGEIS